MLRDRTTPPSTRGTLDRQPAVNRDQPRASSLACASARSRQSSASKRFALCTKRTPARRGHGHAKRGETRGKETEAKRGHDEKVRRPHSARRDGGPGMMEGVALLDENVFMVLLRVADVGVSDRG